MSRQVYYITSSNNRIPLHTVNSHVGLYDSYRRFISGSMSSAGFGNYQSYLEQIQPHLSREQCVHFVICDGKHYGFQKLYYTAGGSPGMTSEGEWASAKDRNAVFAGMDWIMVEREQLAMANRNRGTAIANRGTTMGNHGTVMGNRGNRSSNGRRYDPPVFQGRSDRRYNYYY